MSLEELLANIPSDEMRQFERFLRIGKAGDVIITEGAPNDNALYLLRAGKIGVFRRVNGSNELITEIEPNNFFGEMEMMELEGHRSATCSVISEYAVYYGFKNVDISTLIKNPLWGQTLITRLCQDLHLFADRIVQLETANKEVVKELEDTRKCGAQLLGAYDYLHQKVACQMPMNPKEWAYIKGIYEMTRNFVLVRLPDIHYKVSSPDARALRVMDDEGLLPRKLKDLLPL